MKLQTVSDQAGHNQYYVKVSESTVHIMDAADGLSDDVRGSLVTDHCSRRPKGSREVVGA